MPSSPLKHPSAGGRLRRLLASLRPPAKAGPLPVQTGFPTSLADLVVKNHGRFQYPRRRHRAAAVVPAEPAPQQRPELPAAHDEDAAVAVAAPPARPEGAAFRVRPELLAGGGAVALALVLIWSKRLVAAATLASVALLWVESARSRTSTRRPRRPETEEELSLRGRVSPMREAAESSPEPSCEAAGSSDLDPSVTPAKRKEKRRRSLRKLLAKKWQSGKRPAPCRDTDSLDSVDEVNAAEEATLSAPEVVTEEGSHCPRGRALPLVLVAPIILVGLVAGMLPAVALTVLCAVFSSGTIDGATVPHTQYQAQLASGDQILR